MTDLRVGIDVGGTNTDAVLVDDRDRVLRSTKGPTTPDPIEGIERALTQVLPGEASDRARVGLVALGSTHSVNAVVQRRGLRRVALLRLGAPGATAVPPFAGWPRELVAEIDAGHAILAGGVEVDGRTHPIDPGEVRRSLEAVAERTEAVAVTGIFSPIDPSRELEAEAIVGETLGAGVPVSLGHRIGGLGILEREAAAVLNAALGGVTATLVDALEGALARHDLGAAAFLVQNDGTLMTAEHARRSPVLTIGSGPANSLRGAGALTGVQDALVVDVGGTSTDIGAIVRGFPRESAAGAEIGGVRTNFRMPDLVSLPVGGGTIVREDGTLAAESVGYRLTESSLVFGGSTPTLTDAAVAEGRATLGDPGAAEGARALLGRALATAEATVADALERVKLSRGSPAVILVGGGGILLPDDLPGAGTIHRPDGFEVANAVGAALAAVGGESDRVVFGIKGSDARREAIDACLDDARARAAEAGADPGALETIWVEEIPLAYLDVPAVRIRAKVAGPLA